MHYKNGREAKSGDPVIGKLYYGEVVSGNLIDLQPSSTSCNSTLLRAIGPLSCVTVGEFYHAEDAFNAIEPKVVTSPPVTS
jgi:hypothetical protein